MAKVAMEWIPKTAAQISLPKHPTHRITATLFLTSLARHLSDFQTTVGNSLNQDSAMDTEVLRSMSSTIKVGAIMNSSISSLYGNASDPYTFSAKSFIILQ
jgi:hypothetical protein